MPMNKKNQAEISGYISSLLRTHFGKGPASIYVTITPPFLAIHVRGFITPMETVLLKQQEQKRIMELRDVMITEFHSEIIDNLQKMAGLKIKELYADWNLKKESGMIIGIAEEKPEDNAAFEGLGNVDKKALEEAINKSSEEAEKKPDKTEIFMLSDRILLVKRTGILVRIEKELIKNGYAEVLRLAKRPLEQQLLEKFGLGSILNRELSELFFDWNFDSDIGYIVINVKPE